MATAKRRSSAKKYVIEFRNGSFFQNLDADRGGPRATAKRFDSEAQAKSFMRQHEWILFNGGMVLPAKKSPARKSRATASVAKVSVGAKGDVGIRYSRTPPAAILRELHGAGFRYYRGAGWFAPPSEKALSLARLHDRRFDFA